MSRDRIVEEIHQVRRKLLEECGGDLAKLFERLKAAEAAHPDHVVAPGTRRGKPVSSD